MVERGENMPKIDVNLKDLENLLGRKLPRDRDELESELQTALGEVEELEGDEMELEIKGSNRPDLWSVEGVARQLRFSMGLDKPPKRYDVGDSELEINALKSIEDKRPYIACAVIRNVDLSEEILKSLIQTQEKIDGSFGRDRERTSIGLYDYDLIKGPIDYKAVDPKKNSFVPLDFEEEMNLEKILEKHPKGQEYGHIIDKYEKFPILMDSEGKILSLPPIINSNDLGQVIGDTENILIEVTGTGHEAVRTVLQILSSAFGERGGNIEKVKVNYEFREDEWVPNFVFEEMELNPEEVRNLLGLEISEEEIAKLLSKYGYDVKSFNESSIVVKYPSYRIDIMHKYDVIEDVAIAFGYDNFEPEEPEIATEGGISEMEGFIDDSRQCMTNLGFQEILSFTLTSPSDISEKMGLESKNSEIEISNPISENYSTLRDSILPSLLDFLSENKHRAFPQKIFEAGMTFELEEDEIEINERLGAAVSKNRVNYSELASIVKSFVGHFGLGVELSSKKHRSFISGRCGKVVVEGEEIGVVGEIHPKVLENWGLEKPVVAFELNLEKLKDKK